MDNGGGAHEPEREGHTLPRGGCFLEARAHMNIFLEGITSKCLYFPCSGRRGAGQGKASPSPCVCLLVLPDFLLPQDPLDFPVNVNRSYLSGRLRIHCFVCFLHFPIFKTQNSTIIINIK